METEAAAPPTPPPMGIDPRSPEFLNLRKACEMGSARGCSMFGVGLTQDGAASGKRILKFLRMGCERGDADGCYVMSKLQILQRVPGGADAAFRNSYTACRMGQVQACTQTGLMFIEGMGCKADMSKGLTVLLNACDKLESGQSCFQAARVIGALADDGMHIAWKQTEGSEELNTQEMMRGLLRKGCAFKNEDACKYMN